MYIVNKFPVPHIYRLKRGKESASDSLRFGSMGTYFSSFSSLLNSSFFSFSTSARATPLTLSFFPLNSSSDPLAGTLSRNSSMI